MLNQAARSLLRNRRLTAPLWHASSGLGRFIPKQLVCFLFHSVSDTPSEFHRDFELFSTTETFERQVRYITSHFNVITPDQLVSGAFDGPAALITFDDGARCYFDTALPILEAFGAPSLHFVNMAPIEGKVWWSGLVAYLLKYETRFAEHFARAGKSFFDAIPELLQAVEPDVLSDPAVIEKAKAFYGPFARVDDLAQHDSHPLVYYGNHLFDHFNAAVLSPDELATQYLENHKRLMAFSSYTGMFSYPFGQKNLCYTDATNRQIAELGAKRIFTANPEDYLVHEMLVHRVGLINENVSDRDIAGWVNYRALLHRWRSHSDRVQND